MVDSPKTFSHQDRADQQQSVHLANLNSTPTAGSFRCGEDGEDRQRHACTHTARAGSSSEDAAEELLLPEGVLGGGDGHDEGVVAYVGVAVRHQVGSRFGDLRCGDEGKGHAEGMRCLSDYYMMRVVSMEDGRIT